MGVIDPYGFYVWGYFPPTNNASDWQPESIEYVGFTAPQDCTLVGASVTLIQASESDAETIDIGILSAAGVRLASSGPVAALLGDLETPPAVGPIYVPFTAPLAL